MLEWVDQYTAIRVLGVVAVVSVAIMTRFSSFFRRLIGKIAAPLIFISSIVGVLLVASAVYYHFQVGGDIDYFSIKHPETAQYWGQIGDFVGGMLNPILSFVALMAVILNLTMQRKELEMARQDALENLTIQNGQSQIFEKQNFESVFFRLLDIHSRLSASARIEIYERGSSQVYLGLDAFKKMELYYLPPNDSGYYHGDEYRAAIKRGADQMMKDNSEDLGHYFRNIYQILKYIDGFGHDVLRARGSFLRVRNAVRNYNSQRTYANMLRAQLSSSEVSAIYMNCLTKDGEGLKYYVEKFSFLKTFKKWRVSEDESALSLYKKIAYADSEEIDLEVIRGMSRSHYVTASMRKAQFRGK